MDELPKDNVFEIFSRMPIESLACLSSVCRRFYKHVTDPDLEKIRVKEPVPLMFQQFLASDSDVCCSLSFLRTLEEDGASDSLKVKKDQILDVVRRKDSCERPKNLILGSCNGLILANFSESDRGFALRVINPLSKLCYKLPPIEISSGVQSLRFWSGGIGFDYSINRFKIVCVVSEEVAESPYTVAVKHKLFTVVYVSGSGSGSGSWKEISQIKSYPITGEGVFANGCLHWLVDHIDYRRPLPIDEGKKVVSFDVKKEEFRLIDPPKRKKDDAWINDQLADLNGEVGYVYNLVDIGYNSIELWILKEKEWVIHPLDKTPKNTGPICVAGCWNTEGSMLLTCGNGKHMYVYDKKNGDLEEVDRDDECEANIRMYQNSALSINAFNSNAYAIEC